MKPNNKIGLLTFHCAQNYGAVLQCYATIHYLRDKGFNIETIDYRNKALVDRYKKPGFSFYLNPKNIYRVFKYNSHFVNNPSFAKFCEKHLCLSNQKYNESNIALANDCYDSYIVGSDQVWNLSCNGYDSNYFLKFANSNKKRIALSVSCGGKTELISNHGLVSEVDAFSNVSIREKDDKEKLQSLTKKQITDTFDPVFLLDKNEWSKIEDSSMAIKESYIFIYMVFEDKKLIKYVKKHYKHKKVIYINQGTVNVPGVKNLRNISPEQFIYLLKNAEIVYTNSFHGVALSLIFEKDFGVKLLDKNVTINNRILSLLTEVGGTNHLINSKSFCEKNEKCDIARGKHKLEKYLLSSLENN